MMTPTFSYLDYLISAVIDDGDYPTSAGEARIELAALRAERDALLAELAEYRTLRPAKCNPKCWRNGWDAAQEAAADACEYNARENMKFYQSLAGVASNPDDIGVLKYASYSGQSERDANAIRALVPPADCGGQCNPLAPDKAIDDLADALNDLRDKMGADAWNKFVEMSHK